MLNIYSQLNRPKDMVTLVNASNVFVVSVVLGTGFAAYGAFGSATETVVIFNLPYGSSVSILVQVMYMLNIMGSFSLLVQPIFQLFEKNDAKDEGTFVGSFLFYARRLAVVAAILLLSFALNDINLILSLISGSICGTLLFILPVAFYRKAYIERPSKKERRLVLALAYASAVAALAMGGCGVYQNVSLIMDKYS